MSTQSDINDIVNELGRIHAYTAVLGQLAQNGDHTHLETFQLQAIFEDIGKVTGQAYAKLQDLTAPPCYHDKFDRPMAPARYHK